MIGCYRLLVARLEQEGSDWNYPIHLGVTEAGEGEDGRIKSAIGIGSLLCDGLGDTIRVSLTEDSPKEIEVCRDLMAQVPNLVNLKRAEFNLQPSFDPYLHPAGHQRNSMASNAAVSKPSAWSSRRQSALAPKTNADVKPRFMKS
jgi:4-hydroxy-3-methylbut-2-en-1-yl diphosphate synthase IspG/GcpE